MLKLQLVAFHCLLYIIQACLVSAGIHDVIWNRQWRRWRKYGTRSWNWHQLGRKRHGTYELYRLATFAFICLVKHCATNDSGTQRILCVRLPEGEDVCMEGFRGVKPYNFSLRICNFSLHPLHLPQYHFRLSSNRFHLWHLLHSLLQLQLQRPHLVLLPLSHRHRRCSANGW